MAHLNLTHLNGTPAFTIAGTNPIYARVHAAIYDKKGTRWLFPAYMPFGPLAISDLRKVDPTLQYGPGVEAHLTYLEQVPQLVKDRVLPEGFTFYGHTPFEHQLEGLSLFLHYPRFALWWEPGSGKSRIPLDHMRAAPGHRMLILSQKVTLENWVEQVGIHAGDGLRAVALTGTTEQKREIIYNHKNYDILVASYGTARTMGYPRLHRQTLSYIKKLATGGKTLTDSGLKTLVKAVRRLGDPQEQIKYVQMWADGSTFADVARAVESAVTCNPQWLDDVDYQRCLVDESQNIKEMTSQQTKTIVELGKKASHRYLMSGTPTSGDPRHLYPQMRFLSPAIFPEDWLRFSDLFLVRAARNMRIVTGYKNLNIINERVGRIADNKKKEDCLDLPDRVITDVHVNMTKEQVRLYNTLITAMGVDLTTFFNNPTGTDLEIQNAATLLNKLCQVTSGFVLDKSVATSLCDGCPHLRDCVERKIVPYTAQCQVAPEPRTDTVNYLKENPKLDALDGLLDTLLEDPARKVIIWAYYHAELDAIQSLLDKKELRHERMDGRATGSLQDRIRRFNTDPQTRVYLGQIATGVGITLNAATYMIYYSLDWSLEKYLQSIDRNYRAGQDKKVTVYRLIAKGTVEEYKARALSQKKDLSVALTGKLACVNCVKRFECLDAGVELYEAGCIYQRSAKRTIAKAELLS
jgi:SNF2 family DNA or RNA helicase